VLKRVGVTPETVALVSEIYGLSIGKIRGWRTKHKYLVRSDSSRAHLTELIKLVQVRFFLCGHPGKFTEPYYVSVNFLSLLTEKLLEPIMFPEDFLSHYPR
jgi:hypothetical protein